LPSEDVQRWQAALTAKAGSTANRLNVIAFLMQSNEINPECKFSAKQSTLLLDRLNNLPADRIKSWRDALKLDTDQAAMSLVENNELFDEGGQLQEEAFSDTLRVIKEKEVPTTKTVPQKPAVLDAEQAGAKKLKLAKDLLSKNKELGRKRLQEIVNDFKGTAAAMEAEELLK